VQLLAIDDPLKRVFYEIECIRGTWNVRELQRQIYSSYFERSGLSQNKEKLSDLVHLSSSQLEPNDIIQSPFMFEFLGLNTSALVTETELEQALIDNLKNFLLELGYGFCFEARQKRILIGDEYFFVDLVFYHRVLKCHVLIELKNDKFKQHYISQLDTYLNYYREEVRLPEDNPPVGILLCTHKNNALVKYATASLDKNIFVQKYLLKLPATEEIEEYIKKLIK
jgi:predicted nuclease of restriction endonuclease-like (RecB) superfamily